jgi:hypothetical protein
VHCTDSYHARRYDISYTHFLQIPKRLPKQTIDHQAFTSFLGLLLDKTATENRHYEDGSAAAADTAPKNPPPSVAGTDTAPKSPLPSETAVSTAPENQIPSAAAVDTATKNPPPLLSETAVSTAPENQILSAAAVDTATENPSPPVAGTDTAPKSPLPSETAVSTAPENQIPSAAAADTDTENQRSLSVEYVSLDDAIKSLNVPSRRMQPSRIKTLPPVTPRSTCVPSASASDIVNSIESDIDSDSATDEPMVGNKRSRNASKGKAQAKPKVLVKRKATTKTTNPRKPRKRVECTSTTTAPQALVATSNPELHNISTKLGVLTERVTSFIDVASKKTSDISGERSAYSPLGSMAIKQIMEESAMNSQHARNLEKQRAAADGVGTLIDKAKGDHQILKQGGEIYMNLINAQFGTPSNNKHY